MGKMKDIYMEIVNREHNGDHDAYIQQLAKESCKEFSYVSNVPCPNCFNTSLHRNEKEAICDACGQDFIYIGNALRFK